MISLLRPSFLMVFVCMIFLPGLVRSEEILSGKPVSIDWKDKKFTNLSGAAVVGKYLIVCDDESKHSVHVLDQTKTGYRYQDTVKLSESNKELDLEGVAPDGTWVYVVGSHSRNKDGERRPAREKIYRFELSTQGKLKGKVGEISLSEIFDGYPELKKAMPLKPKEGGIDLEGIAIRDSWIFVGFRGPLAEKNALVLKFRWEDPKKSAELLEIDLGGLGIRDLAQVNQGFLVLAGPLNAAPGPYEIYSWNGLGGNHAISRKLGRISVPSDARAEAMAMLTETAKSYEFLIVFDGPLGGAPQRLMFPK